MMKYLKALYRLLKNKSSGFSFSGFKKHLNNEILSSQVALKAVRGKGNTISKNTFIDGNSEINSYSYIGFNCFITRSVIGNYASIANNVSIGMGEHKLDGISTSSLFYEDAYETLTEKDCIIGNDVWIGVDCIIRRGVRIGDGAVIGANSVVTKDIPDFAIAVGSPAKVIKYRFNEAQQKIIKDSAWWKLDPSASKKIHEKIFSESVRDKNQENVKS